MWFCLTPRVRRTTAGRRAPLLTSPTTDRPALSSATITFSVRAPPCQKALEAGSVPTPRDSHTHVGASSPSHPALEFCGSEVPTGLLGRKPGACGPRPSGASRGAPSSPLPEVPTSLPVSLLCPPPQDSGLCSSAPPPTPTCPLPSHKDPGDHTPAPGDPGPPPISSPYLKHICRVPSDPQSATVQAPEVRT